MMTRCFVSPCLVRRLVQKLDETGWREQTSHTDTSELYMNSGPLRVHAARTYLVKAAHVAVGYRGSGLVS